MQISVRVVIFILFMKFLSVSAQVSVKDSCIKIPMFFAHYAFQVPGNDMANRFLDNSNLGAGFLFKTKKNLLFGADINYIFRDAVKENNILQSISTPDGFIIDGNGQPADVSLTERGFYTSLKCGKIFSILNPNPNSGVVAIGSVGFLQHKINISNPNNTAPQIAGDYKKGYDRLTNGIAFSEFIGYMYFSKNRLTSFFAGFEFVQAFTKNRRDINFDTQTKDYSKRTDLLSGFKIGWIIPLYPKIRND
jgi:hypothetical protein